MIQLTILRDGEFGPFPLRDPVNRRSLRTLGSRDGRIESEGTNAELFPSTFPQGTCEKTVPSVSVSLRLSCGGRCSSWFRFAPVRQAGVSENFKWLALALGIR
jgi:hypothetical protein